MPDPRAYQTCPVCAGRGRLPHGFYNTSPAFGSTNTADETCRTCNGKRVILAPPDAVADLGRGERAMSQPVGRIGGTRRDEYWEDWLNNASWEDSVCLASDRLLFFIAQDAGDVVHLELTQSLLQQLAARMAAVEGLQPSEETPLRPVEFGTSPIPAHRQAGDCHLCRGDFVACDCLLAMRPDRGQKDPSEDNHG